MVTMDELSEMDCSVLKRLMKDDSAKSLLLDCRSFLAFSAGHLRGAVNIRCNTIVRRRAKGSVSLDQILSGDDEARARLKSGLYSAVILYDERTSDTNTLREDSTITLVHNALCRDTYRTEIYLLKGKFKSTLYTEKRDCVIVFLDATVLFEIKLHALKYLLYRCFDCG